jgi:hypothetical protein
MEINVSFDVDNLVDYWGEKETDKYIAECIKEYFIKELKKSPEYKAHIKQMTKDSLDKLAGE